MRFAPAPHPFDMHGSPEIAGITSQPLLLRLALARLAAFRPRAELLLRMSLRRIKQLLAGAALARMAAGRCHRATLRRTAHPQPRPPLPLKKRRKYSVAKRGSRSRRPTRSPAPPPFRRSDQTIFRLAPANSCVFRRYRLVWSRRGIHPRQRGSQSVAFGSLGGPSEGRKPLSRGTGQPRL